MKFLPLLFLALAACGKANDVPAMKAETEGLLKNYQARFEVLNRRADSIMQRGNAIGVASPDAANASRAFAMAKGKLVQLDADAKAGLGEVAKIKDKLELQRYFDRKHHELEAGYTEINADFGAIESWITNAEQRPKQVATRQPVVPPPAPEAGDAGSPPPGNPGTEGAGGTPPNPPR